MSEPRPFRTLSAQAHQELDEARKELAFVVAMIRGAGETDLDEDAHMGFYLALSRINDRLFAVMATLEPPPTAT